MYNVLALALLGRKAEALREVARAKLLPLAQDPGGGPYDGTCWPRLTRWLVSRIEHWTCSRIE
jgi:hypothetical protein